MEQHGYPPLVMSLESQDWLDHVIFVYRHKTGWGSVARSRDPGLHGRKPRFRSPRALARSYYDGYVDNTGRVKGFGVANLADALPGYDWRLTTKNAWKVEQMLIDWPHRKIKTSIRRYRVLLKKYRAYRAAHDDRKPIYYRGKDKWEPLPKVFTLVEADLEIGDQRQVIGRHQRHAIAWHRDLQDFDLALVIDVIEMQDREEARIGAAAGSGVCERSMLCSRSARMSFAIPRAHSLKSPSTIFGPMTRRS